MAASLQGVSMQGITIGVAIVPPVPYQTTINGDSGTMVYFSDYQADFASVAGLGSGAAWLTGTPGGETYPTPPNDQPPGSWVSTYATLSNSNKTVTFNGVASGTALSSIGSSFTAGGTVVEITIGQITTACMVGTFSAGSPDFMGPDNLYGFNPDTYGGNAYLSYVAYYENNGLIGGSFSASPYTTGDVIGVLVIDGGIDGALVYFYKNGIPQNPADPITGFAYATAGFSVGMSV